MDNEYVLTIKLEDIEDKSNLAKPDDKKEEENKDIATMTNTMLKATAYVASEFARPLIVSKVGEVTRDSLLGTQVNLAFGIAQQGLAFAISPSLGFASMGINLASNLIDYNISATKESRRLAINRERAGYMNRSR